MRSVVRRLNRFSRRTRAVIAACAITCAATAAMAPRQAQAVIIFNQSGRNTSTPTGSVANSGWQWQGKFGGFLATAISKKYIITAGHFNNAVGTSFSLNGKNHRTVEVWDDPESDLRISKCVGLFESWAPLWKDNTDKGRSVVLFGRGTQRGEEVRVNGALKGWKWGAEDGVQSWGRNSINEVVQGGKGQGDLLRMSFDQEFGPSAEGHLSRGDSGGGVFARQGKNWKLVGVNFSTDGPYSLTQGGQTFDAAIFDRSGLFETGNGAIPSGPGSSYATRLASRINWISDVFNGRATPGIPSGGGGGGGGPVTPEPTGAAIFLGAGAIGLLRRTRR